MSQFVVYFGWVIYMDDNCLNLFIMYYKNFYIKHDFLGLIAYNRLSGVYLRSRTLSYMVFLIDTS